MFINEVIKPLFESIDTYGSSNAFCINEVYYTYNELGDAISKIRMAIQRFKVAGENIGLVANDDLETYASIFAIWLEGAAYVPLHPQQPFERNEEIVREAELVFVLDSSKKFNYTSVLNIETSIIQSRGENLKPKEVSDTFLAYILFTSGSTGKPKGVQITRNNIGAFMKSFWETGIEIDGRDRCLQCFDLTFDVSVQSFLVPLTRGACTFTIPHDQIKSSYVYSLLVDNKMTFGAMAPSMIRLLRPYFSEIEVPSFRYSILTAEASPLDLILEWAKCIPNADIFNFYGPTEATIYCTYSRIKRYESNKQLNGMLSIGKAMSGFEAIIIDDSGNILSSNQKGELCVFGDQITTGYWKDPDQNNNSFLNIEIDCINKRFYKTGDNCYIDDEGDIMLFGRLDFQIKIQGYRIELGEIEFHAREFLENQNAIAIAYNDDSGNTEIALFIEGKFEDEQRLIDYFRSKLPSYMVPSIFVAEKIFPLNSNGKIDRIRLKSRLI